jgi:DNA end-binding protein Ku
VIRESMRKTGMVALGRLVMSTRERICALEVEEDALLMTTLRTADEVRSVEDVGPIDLPKRDPRMLDIAQKIIEQQAGEFDPAEFKDRYEDALRALMEKKRKGLPIRPAAVPEHDGKVVDLMDALRKSLQSGARTPPAASVPVRATTGRAKKAANTNRRPAKGAAREALASDGQWPWRLAIAKRSPNRATRVFNLRRYTIQAMPSDAPTPVARRTFSFQC